MKRCVVTEFFVLVLINKQTHKLMINLKKYIKMYHDNLKKTCKTCGNFLVGNKTLVNHMHTRVFLKNTFSKKNLVQPFSWGFWGRLILPPNFSMVGPV